MVLSAARTSSSAPSSSSVEAMMQKAVTTSEAFHRGSAGVPELSFEGRKSKLLSERKEKKSTLSQWYGMKVTPLSEEQKKDVELLQYRSFLNKDTAHQAPKRSAGLDQTEFVEFGFVAGTGKAKKRRYKSFADEWIEENPELESIVKKRVRRNVTEHRKEKEHREKIAKRRDAKRSKGTDSKRKRKQLNESRF